MSRPRTVLAMAPDPPTRLFDNGVRNRLRAIAVVDPNLVLGDFGSPATRAALCEAEVLLTGWTGRYRAVGAARRITAV
jgi:hypothetical protein